MRARLAAVCVLALVLAAPAGAGGRPTLAHIEQEVMCPTCHTLLELSHAPIAERMRAFIRRRIAAGDSEPEIKRQLVAEFGEGVLASPPAHGFGLVAWLVPVGGFLTVGGAVAIMLRRWRRNVGVDPPTAAAPLAPSLALLLDRELADFDG